MKIRSLIISLLLLPLAAVSPASAQGAAETNPDLLSMVGLTFGDGPHSTYVKWEPTDARSAQNLVYAVYRSNGPVGAALPFSRVAITRLQTDARTISALQPRAVAAGQDLAALDTSLTALFQAYIPDPGVSTAEKLAAVIHGSRDNPEQQNSLAFLARCQPLAAMSLGLAVIDPLPAAGEYTYELREYDAAAQQDIRVLGRVTVDTAANLVLPAPGAPVEVTLPDARSQEGHLAVHLRWATPDGLRLRSPMQAGFNVYRARKDYAEDPAREWQSATPTPDALALAIAQGTGDVVAVNRVPVFPDELLNGAQAADAADRETYFVTDDNHRFEEGVNPLNNGEQFYYFVTALDILCNDRSVSPGTLATVCDRQAPIPPGGVHITNEVAFTGADRIQRLGVRWPAHTDADSGISEYLVYRWSSIEEIQQFRSDPSPRLIATVPHVEIQETYLYLDDGAGAPQHPPAGADPDLSGTLFYYTVRAVDASACGGNVSANSPPARGILRESEGPEAPAGDTLITCYDPDLQFVSASATPDPDAPQNNWAFRLVCGAVAKDTFEWAEFRFLGSVSAPVPEFLGRVYFAGDGIESQLASLRAQREVWPHQFQCRVKTRGGVASPWVQGILAKPPKTNGDRYTIVWAATVVEVVAPAGGNIGTAHCGLKPGSGDRNPTCVTVTPTPGSRELRIYRQVEDGPLTLVHVEALADDSTPVVWKDEAIPAGFAEGSYFAQALDENGLASPMTPVGPYIQWVSDSQMPVPFLLQPEAITDGGPRMRLQWTCAPYGIERFEIWISREGRTPVPSWPTSGLSDNLVPAGLIVNPLLPNNNFGIYQTGLVGGLPATEEGTLFSFDLPVSVGEPYDIVVRAVGPGSLDSGRAAGGFSNFEKFRWNKQEADKLPTVPWPARELPPSVAATTFDNNIEALYLNTLASGPPPWKGVGIRIGAYEYRGGDPDLVKAGAHGPTSTMPAYYLPQATKVEDALFRRPTQDGGPPDVLWPLVLFRVQLPSTTRPLVSADTVQVSPFMEAVAHETGFTLGGLPANIIHDPFVAARPMPSSPAEGNNYEVFLLDRHPLIRGASYQYLLVRFGPDNEIEEVLGTNTVTIP